jgi:hypothetical protein
MTRDASLVSGGRGFNAAFFVVCSSSRTKTIVKVSPGRRAASASMNWEGLLIPLPSRAMRMSPG